MKFNFNGYDVEIKAKADYKTNFNKKDTMALMNFISTLYGDSSNLYKKLAEVSEGRKKELFTYYAEDQKKISRKIYDALDELGLYEGL